MKFKTFFLTLKRFTEYIFVDKLRNQFYRFLKSINAIWDKISFWQIISAVTIAVFIIMAISTGKIMWFADCFILVQLLFEEHDIFGAFKALSVLSSLILPAYCLYIIKPEKKPAAKTLILFSLILYLCFSTLEGYNYILLDNYSKYIQIEYMRDNFIFSKLARKVKNYRFEKFRELKKSQVGLCLEKALKVGMGIKPIDPEFSHAFYDLVVLLLKFPDRDKASILIKKYIDNENRMLPSNPNFYNNFRAARALVDGYNMQHQNHGEMTIGEHMNNYGRIYSVGGL